MTKRPDVPFDLVGDCHVCTLYKTAESLGRRPTVKASHYTQDAARYVFMQSSGKIPDGSVVYQTCGNLQCINPEHLKVGTESDVKQQMLADGRFAIGVRNGRAKLDEDKVRQIRRSGLGSKVLGRMFDVDPKAIRAIKKGITWKHVV